MATTITLDPIWQGNVFVQRAVTGAVYIRVSGTYTGVAPIHVQAQVADLVGGTVRLAWALIASEVIANGRFSGWIAFPAYPQYLTLSVRDSGNVGVTNSSAGFGTGDKYILDGQSQDERFAGVVSGSPPSRACAMGIYFADYAESLSMIPAGAGFVGWLAPTADGVVTLANALNAYSGVGVGFVFTASGGCPLCKESVGGSAPYQFLNSIGGNIANYPAEAHLLKDIQMLTDSSVEWDGPDFAGVIFMGAQSDALATSADSVVKALDARYKAFRSVTRRSPSQMPFFLCPVGKWLGNTAGMTRVREGTLQWALTTPGAVVCGDHYDLLLADGIVHLDVSVTPRFARRTAMDVLHQVNPGANPVPGAGPFISKAVISGAVITALIDLNGHSGVALTTPGNPATGFQASNDNFATSLTISNATLSGNVLTITLSATPTGTVRLKYNPLDVGASDNLIFSTDHVTGDSIGSPLQSTPCGILAIP